MSRGSDPCPQEGPSAGTERAPELSGLLLQAAFAMTRKHTYTDSE